MRTAVLCNESTVDKYEERMKHYKQHVVNESLHEGKAAG